MSRKVLIITGANTAREINPFGDKPDQNNDKYTSSQNPWWTYREDRNAWELAEASLKEYRITGYMIDGKFVSIQWGTIEVGLKVECECNDQDLTCIIL